MGHRSLIQHEDSPGRQSRVNCGCAIWRCSKQIACRGQGNLL